MFGGAGAKAGKPAAKAGKLAAREDKQAEQAEGTAAKVAIAAADAGRYKQFNLDLDQSFDPDDFAIKDIFRSKIGEAKKSSDEDVARTVSLVSEVVEEKKRLEEEISRLTQEISGLNLKLKRCNSENEDLQDRV
jgi:hypothetical protein